MLQKLLVSLEICLSFPWLRNLGGRNSVHITFLFSFVTVRRWLGKELFLGWIFRHFSTISLVYLSIFVGLQIVFFPTGRMGLATFVLSLRNHCYTAIELAVDHSMRSRQRCRSLPPFFIHPLQSWLDLLLDQVDVFQWFGTFASDNLYLVECHC